MTPDTCNVKLFLVFLDRMTDSLQDALSKTVDEVCTHLITYSSSYAYKALIGVTLDNKITLMYNLQGSSGTHVIVKFVNNVHT